MGCMAKRFQSGRCMPACTQSGEVHGTTEVEVAAQVDREQVSGAVNLVFAGRPLTNAYRNLTNVVLRVAPARRADRPAVLVNAHFDRRSPHSPTPGGLPALSAVCGRPRLLDVIAHQAGPCCLLQHACAPHL